MIVSRTKCAREATQVRAARPTCVYIYYVGRLVEDDYQARYLISPLILRDDACPANYQQEAVPAAGPGGGGGGGYGPGNPYDDRSSNANIINRGGYSTQPYG